MIQMIEDLLNYLETTSLEPHDDYTSEFTYKDQKILYKYIKQLQQENQKQKEKLDKYENPEDMTLFTMWCTEKVKDENKQLKEEYNKIQKAYESTFSDYQELKGNWNKLKEYIDIKLYNVEYLQKLCGCRIDAEIHMILDIIKKEMQELEESDINDSN